MKKQFNLELVLLFVLVFAITIGAVVVQIFHNPFGWGMAPTVLTFNVTDLQGLELRSDLRCAGAVIGHVKDISPDFNSGKPRFVITAAIDEDYQHWQFQNRAEVEANIVPSSFSPSAIILRPATNDDKKGTAVTPRAWKKKTKTAGVATSSADNKDETPIALSEKQPSLVSKAGEAIAKLNNAIDEFTNIRAKDQSSAFKDLMATIQNTRETTDSLAGHPSSKNGEDPGSKPPVDRLLAGLEDTDKKLADLITEAHSFTEKDGKLSIVAGQLQKLTDENGHFTILLRNLEDYTKKNGEVTRVLNDVSQDLRKLNILLPHVDDTVQSVKEKIDGLGTTFVGKAIFGKQNRKASPSPSPSPTKTSRLAR